MSAQLPPSALRALQEAYKNVTPPRVFRVAAGRHFGQRTAKLNNEQLGHALEAVHEQYQRGLRGLRLKRNAAMRMAAHCNTNSLVFLSLLPIAGQVIRVYLRWRVESGVTETSGAFAATRERKPSRQPVRR